MRASNLKSYLPAVIISSRNYHPPSRNYRIISHGKNDNSCRITMPQLPRYQSQFAQLGRYINKQYPGTGSSISSTFLSTLLCFYLTTAFLPSFHSRTAYVFVYCTRACVRAAAIRLRGIQNITIPLASLILSDFSLIFRKGKRARQLRTPCLRASSPRVVSLISICRLFVSFTFFIFLSLPSLFLSQPSRSALSSTYILYFVLVR